MRTLPELIRSAHLARASGDPDRLDSALGELHLALQADLPSEPLLAASCLKHVTDPVLRERLDGVARSLSSRSASAKALVTTPEGRGLCIEILVDLAPGNSGVWCPHSLSRDAELAAQLAAAVALGPEQEHWAVRWQLKGEGLAAATQLRGSSLGLAMAVAVRAAHASLDMDPESAFSGGVDLDGKVAPVSSLPAKTRAAQSAGVSRVFLPESERAGLKVPDGVELRGVETVEAVFHALWPVQKTLVGRSWNWRLMGLVLPFLLAWSALLDGAELWVRGPMMQAVLGSLPADNAVVLGLPDGDRLELRWEYPEKMDALVDAGVTAIGFDVLFLKNSDADVLFAEAIERAEAAGVEVILPRRFDGQDFLPISEALSQAGHSAMVILEEDLLFGTVRRLPARLVGASGERHWGLSSMLLAGHLGVGEPSWVGTDLAIGVTRNPTHSERLILPPVDAPRTVQWDSSFKEEGLEGKAVLIGAMQGHADALRTPSGHRYGVEIHAAAFETLARQRGLRVLPSWLEGFVAFLFAFGSWQLSQWFGRRGQRIVWLLPLGGLGLCAGALKAGWVLAVFPIWIGVGVGVWASKRL